MDIQHAASATSRYRIRIEVEKYDDDAGNFKSTVMQHHSPEFSDLAAAEPAMTKLAVALDRIWAGETPPQEPHDTPSGRGATLIAVARRMEGPGGAGEPAATLLDGVLADLRHWAAANDVDYEEAEARANANFDTEYEGAHCSGCGRPVVDACGYCGTKARDHCIQCGRAIVSSRTPLGALVWRHDDTMNEQCRNAEDTDWRQSYAEPTDPYDRTHCIGCGYPLVRERGDAESGPGEWEHDAAPSMWGNDHAPRPASETESAMDPVSGTEA